MSVVDLKGRNRTKTLSVPVIKGKSSGLPKLPLSASMVNGGDIAKYSKGVLGRRLCTATLHVGLARQKYTPINFVSFFLLWTDLTKRAYC
jgi:hypothetical protein